MKRSIVMTATLFLVSLTSLPAAQQVYAAEEARQLEEIVVTARRREETAQSVPIPITAVTADDLERRAALDLTDLSRVTPNLAIGNSGVARNSASVFLRGIGQGNWGPAQDPKVGIYLDGVYLARPQGSVFDFLDIERVEVVRGPQGTLFGRNTTAGLVHVITKKPGNTFEARVEGLAGDDGQLGGGVALNFPIADTLAARLSVQHRESDGYVENRFDGSDWYDENSQNARGSLLWAPTDRFEATLSFDAQRVREKPTIATCEWVGGDDPSLYTGLDGLAVLGGFDDDVKATCQADRPYSGYEADPEDSSEIDSWGTALTLNYDLTENMTFTSISAYRDIEEVNGSWGITGDSPAGDIISVQQRSNLPSEYDQFSQEFRISGVAMDGRLTYVGGLYYFTENGTATFDVPLFEGWTPVDCVANPFQLPCFPSPTPPLVLQDIVSLTQATGFAQVFDADNESQAVFAEVTYDFTDAFSVTAGLRYTEDDRELSLRQELLLGFPDPRYVCPDGSLPVNSTCNQDDDYSETTPRVILNYAVSDDFMVYGGWSKGYSTGGFNQDPGLAPYEPEESKNWEVGFKSTWLDRRVKLNATAYHNTYDNQQLSVARTIRNQQVIVILNAQEATLYGVEVELLAELGNWSLSFAGGTTDGEYDKFTVEDVTLGPPPDFLETTVTRDLSDNELVLGSPYTLSLGVGYEFNLGDAGSVDANVGYSYRGRTYYDIDEHRNTRQDAYGLMDARIVWSLPNGRTSISVVANNLLDEEYWTGATGDPDDARNGFYWGEPRRVRAEIRHYFGG